MEWDQDICLQLINEYKNKEVLWNPRDPAYYNKVKKEEAWEELCERFGKGNEEMKKKINSLKGSYRREKARAKTRAGKGRHKSYKSRWFAYESLQFLEDRDDRRTLSNLHTVSDDEKYGNETLDESEERELEEDEMDEKLVNLQTLITEQITNKNQNKKFKKFPKKRLMEHKPADEDRIEEAFGYLQQTAALHQQKDQCSLFGDYIADKLRTFDNHFRAIAQHKISDILFELEMHLYKKSSTDTNM